MLTDEPKCTEVKYVNPLTPNGKKILGVHENSSDNLIILIIHSLICYGGDFTLALGIIYDY